MKKNPIIVGLGETLWDVFPDRVCLGGAPLNFACSAAELAGTSASVSLVSAVGQDDLGRRAIDALQQHNVKTETVQANGHETGQVLVELDASGVASYRFADDGAWDDVEWNDQLRHLAANCDAVCFGTLGQRNEVSQKTIQAFVSTTSAGALRVLDVNLRSPFYNDTTIRESLALANVLKLNDEELPVLASLCGVTSGDVRGSDVEIMRQLAVEFRLQGVALTRGAAGAVLVWEDEVSDLPGIQMGVVDTVGAGDAFTAAMVLGLLAGKNIAEINRQANATAAYVCSQPGATMSFPEGGF